MSCLIHRSKPSEPTFWRTSAKRAASWFLQCFSLSFVSSEDSGGIASLVLPSAQEDESGYESGMNRGYESRDRFFSTGKTPRVPQEHKDSLCFTATVAQDRQLFPPRRTDCRKQAPSFKPSSGTPRHSALQVLASYAKLHPSATAPRMLQTTLVPGHPQDCSITPSIGTFH